MDEAKLCNPICSPLKHWLWDVLLGIVMEKNLSLSVEQYCLQTLQFLIHLTDLLTILLRCNGFTGIQKVVVGQTGSRPPNSDHDLFWCKLGFGKCFGASSQSSHWAGHCQLWYKVHFLSHVTIQSRNGSLLLGRIREENTSIILICGQLIRNWVIELFQHFKIPRKVRVGWLRM